jgi:hypothetical protein
LYRIYIQTLALGSSLYIRYNTAAHVVNITYELLNFAMNLRTLQRSSEYLWSKFREIDYNPLSGSTLPLTRKIVSR